MSEYKPSHALRIVEPDLRTLADAAKAFEQAAKRRGAAKVKLTLVALYEGTETPTSFADLGPGTEVGAVAWPGPRPASIWIDGAESQTGWRIGPTPTPGAAMVRFPSFFKKAYTPVAFFTRAPNRGAIACWQRESLDRCDALVSFAGLARRAGSMAAEAIDHFPEVAWSLLLFDKAAPDFVRVCHDGRQIDHPFLASAEFCRRLVGHQTEIERKASRHVFDRLAERCAAAYRRAIDDGDPVRLQKFCEQFAEDEKKESGTKVSSMTLYKKLTGNRDKWDAAGKYRNVREPGWARKRRS